MMSNIGLKKYKVEIDILICSIIILFAVSTFILVFFRSLGCVLFEVDEIQITFYVSGIFSVCVFVFEFYKKSWMKNLVIGVLWGCILSLYDEKIPFLMLVFFINVIWIRLQEKKNIYSIVCEIAEMIIWTLCVLEICAMCMLFNYSAYENIVEDHFFFEIIDVLLVITAIIFLICKIKKIEENNGVVDNSGLNKTRCFMWCLLIILVLIFCILEINSLEVKSGTSFFFGKSMDNGYLYQENGDKIIYFVRKMIIENEVYAGNVLSNPEVYEHIVLDEGPIAQIYLLRICRFVCSLQYGIVFNVILMGCVVYYLLNRAKTIASHK